MDNLNEKFANKEEVLDNLSAIRNLLSGGENKCLSAVFAYDRLVLIHDFSFLSLAVFRIIRDYRCSSGNNAAALRRMR